MDVAKFREQSLAVGKFAHVGNAYFGAAIDLALNIASDLDHRPLSGARVLDLGCGIGDTVTALLKRGYDAYGVDIGEWWGKDHDAYWQQAPTPSQDVQSRLSVANETVYRLPYADNHFDFAMSSQVFEHVFNYADVFRELGRVLKPTAISVNIFPGRGSPFEPHLAVPITALCHHSWWLKTWATFRRRYKKTWREEWQFLHESMRSNNYPSRKMLGNYAKEAGVRISFVEALYIAHSQSRPTKILANANRLGMGWAASPILERLSQRAMILSKGP